MFNTTEVNINSEFDLNELKGLNIKILSVESEKNKGYTYLIKTEKKVETVVSHLAEEEWKEAQLSFKASDSIKIKVIGDYNSVKTDSIIITYEAIDRNGKAKLFENCYEIDGEEEDEDYGEADVEENELNEEEDSKFEDESDMNEIANDLWNDCEEGFDEVEKKLFLNKKRKL